MKYRICTSLTRIARFGAFEVDPLPHSHWSWGDYVVAEVIPPLSWGRRVERVNGRFMQLDVGDRLVGALGTRFATLECTGTWEAVGEDGEMNLLSGGGMLGKITSSSPMMGPPVSVRYVGHVLTNSRPHNMADFAIHGVDKPFDKPVILIAGSSMSAGKTFTAALIIRRLTEMGIGVVGAKLTGAGRFRDILNMHDAGAVEVYDFVDAGMPSTVCPEARFIRPMERLLSVIGNVSARVAVIEVGASPLEPYNGDVAVRLIEPWVRMMVLCASDPYSVVGITHAWGKEPDLIAGVACNTDAGLALTERLTGIQSLRLLDRASVPVLDGLLRQRLDLRSAAA